MHVQLLCDTVIPEAYLHFKPKMHQVLDGAPLRLHAAIKNLEYYKLVFEATQIHQDIFRRDEAFGRMAGRAIMDVQALEALVQQQKFNIKTINESLHMKSAPGTSSTYHGFIHIAQLKLCEASNLIKPINDNLTDFHKYVRGVMDRHGLQFMRSLRVIVGACVGFGAALYTKLNYKQTHED